MASGSISDDELRHRLAKFYPEVVPPVTTNTRALLEAKLQELEASGGRVNEVEVVHPKDVGGDVRTVVFFDLETTGVKRTTFKPKITELSMVAVSSDDFVRFRKKLEMKARSGKAAEIEFSRPRVMNKLTVCVNPGALIMPQITDVTGLDNYNLEEQQRFGSETAAMVRHFLSRLPKPVCLVAHNGSHFDFPLLNAEMSRVGSTDCLQTLCVDSLAALRDIFRVREEREPRAGARQQPESKRPKVASPSSPLCPPEGPAESPTATAGETLSFDKPFTPPMLAKNQLKEPPTLRTKFDKVKEENGNGCDIVPLTNRAKKRLDFSQSAEAFVQQPKSFSLPLLHEHVFGARPRVSHGAEEDCLALMRVCAHKAESFIQYVNANASRLETLPKMWQ